MRRTPALALLTTAVTLAVAGTTAFVTLDNNVTLAVDGHARQVHGFSRTVGAVLHSAGVPVGPHDSVTPALTAPVEDGSRVTVAHGRQLTLSLDGRSSAPWTTGSTVGSALDQLGVGTDGAYLSTPRSTALPLEGLALTVRRPQHISVLVDGHALQVVTTAPSVGEALRSARVTLGPTDRASVALTAYPNAGMVVRVTRISNSRQQLSKPVAIPTLRRADPSLYKGRTAVLRAGRTGVLVQVFQLTYVDRRLVSKTLVSQRVTVAPQPRVVLVGTRPVPQWTGGRSSGLNWAALARCESSGNPRAVSASGKYRGLYQFDFATWYSVGGSGDPASASAGEQTYRAQVLYSRAGRSPWPVCGRYL